MRTGTCGVADVEAGVAVVDADVAVDDGVDVGSTSSAMSRWAALSRSSEMVCSCPWTKTVKNLEARRMTLNGPSYVGWRALRNASWRTNTWVHVFNVELTCGLIRA